MMGVSNLLVALLISGSALSVHAAECPNPAAIIGTGMPALDATAFRLVDANDWMTRQQPLNVVRQYAPVRTVDQVVSDANRDGRRITVVPVSATNGIVRPTPFPCTGIGFKYDTDDDSGCWRPQGLTGSADAYARGVTPNARRLLVVSWHDDECHFQSGGRRGSRVSFIDITDLDHVRYRHVLLMEAHALKLGATAVGPVNIHAGGIVWVGRYLYVADTSAGFRVFDTEQILEANTTDANAGDEFALSGSHLHAYGYKYVLPQVGAYNVAGCPQLFSWVSVDRSGTQASLLSGEYEDSIVPPEGVALLMAGIPPAVRSRLFRWPLGPDGQLISTAGGIVPLEARAIAQLKVQGGLSRRIGNTTKYFFAGKHDDSGPKLYRKNASGLEDTFRWSSGTAQNLHFSYADGSLWGLDEFDGRPVWACKLNDLL